RRQRRALDVLDQEATFQMRRALLVGRQRTQRQPELRAGARARHVVAGHLAFLELLDRHADLAVGAVAPHVEADARAGLQLRADRGQLPRALDRDAVGRQDHIPGLDPRARRGTGRIDLADQRAARAVEPEGVRELLADLLDHDADAAALHVAGLDQLVLDV